MDVVLGPETSEMEPPVPVVGLWKRKEKTGSEMKCDGELRVLKTVLTLETRTGG